MHRTFKLALAAVLLASATPGFGNQFVTASPGESFSDNWYVLACHQQTQELTVAKRESAYGFVKIWTAEVRLKVNDIVALDAQSNRYPAAQLTKLEHCVGTFSIQ